MDLAFVLRYRKWGFISIARQWVPAKTEGEPGVLERSPYK